VSVAFSHPGWCNDPLRTSPFAVQSACADRVRARVDARSASRSSARRPPGCERILIDRAMRTLSALGPSRQWRASRPSWTPAHGEREVVVT
jgi:hypothetical protein